MFTLSTILDGEGRKGKTVRISWLLFTPQSYIMRNNSNSSLFPNGYSNCTFTHGLLRYFGTLIFLLGMLSTILSICVFTRKPLRRKSCCFYFLILAISDIIHLFTMFVEHLPYSYHIDLIVLHSSICKTTIFLIYFSNHLSNIVLTLASIDRFILIYCPSRSKRYCNVERAKQSVLVVIIVLWLANGHFFYGYERISLTDRQLNGSYDCNIRRENILYSILFRVYDSYIESVFFVIVPFVIMFICSSLIILQIFETRKTIRYNSKGRFYYYTFSTSETIRETVRRTLQEQRATRLRDKDIQLCSMLIGTTFAFLILCLPTEINDIFVHADRDRSCATWLRKVILMLLQQVYYAGHFYIYTLTGQLFRKQLFALLFKKQKQASLPERLLQRFCNGTSPNEGAKTPLATTSFINTSPHRLPTKADPFISNDPSQRLLSNSKYTFGTY